MAWEQLDYGIRNKAGRWFKWDVSNRAKCKLLFFCWTLVSMDIIVRQPWSNQHRWCFSKYKLKVTHLILCVREDVVFHLHIFSREGTNWLLEIQTPSTLISGILDHCNVSLLQVWASRLSRPASRVHALYGNLHGCPNTHYLPYLTVDPGFL